VEITVCSTSYRRNKGRIEQINRNIICNIILAIL
jgi:hypothetical protein